MKLYCEICNQMIAPIIKEENIEYLIRGEKIAIKGYHEYCPNCGTLIYSSNENINLKRAYKEYIKKHDLVTPEEIKEIRNKYGLNQALFAKILNIGEATLKRYESGALPKENYSIKIRSCKNINNLKRYLEENKKNLSISEYRSILETINNLENSEKDFNLLIEESIKTIHKNLNFEKLKGMIAYILKKLHDEHIEDTYMTKLFKLLWLAEKYYYLLTNNKITNLKYIALQHGPIPEEYNIITEYLIKNNVIEEFENTDGGIILKLKDETYIKHLNQKEKEAVDFIIKKFGRHKAGFLGDNVTHKFSEWKNAAFKQEIDFNTEGISFFN